MVRARAMVRVRVKGRVRVRVRVCSGGSIFSVDLPPRQGNYSRLG